MRLALALTAALLALMLAACGGSERVERRIPAPGTFVYTSGVDLWIQDEHGARLLIAAEQDQQLLMPAISPDGETVAYVIFQLTQAPGTTVGSDLAIADMQEPDQRILVEHREQGEYIWTPRWTPEGDALIYTHEIPDQPARVERVALASEQIETLREDARDADISPGGDQLVFVNAPYSGDPHLVVRNLANGTETVLDPERAWEPRPVRIPRFTADGSQVVFSAGQVLPEVSARFVARNGPEDIWSVNLASGALTQLAVIGEDQPDFALSDDGRHVLILGAFGVYLVALPPTDPPYAIAPGEFHGGIDWIGTVSDEEWAEIRNSVFELPDAEQ